jgi:hypothetical protein
LYFFYCYRLLSRPHPVTAVFVACHDCRRLLVTNEEA